MTNIADLQPRRLWQCFEALTRIPRPSKHEGAVLDYVENYAKELKLTTLRDEANNLIIRKPATAGKEKCEGVILQGHIDMVPQKNSDSAHDFLKDPIEAVVEGNRVHAKGTTLGADNGIGVAAAMAVLADENVAHGPLEVLITNDEETTMAGAVGLKSGLLQGTILLNLDSEQDGELFIGCAGGLNAKATFRYTEIETAEDDIAFKVTISGLCGGHSGTDIHLGRANANKLLTRFLKFAAANYEAMLAQIEGGNMHNAIPREAYAIVTIDSEDREDFIEAVDEFEDLFRTEFAATEPALKFVAEQVPTPKNVIDEMTTDDLINALQGCPNGVMRMSDEFEGMVETSSNLSIVKSDAGQIDVVLLIRSSVDSAKEDVGSTVESIFRLAGAEVDFFGDYPGWRPNADSRVLRTVTDAYTTLFGTTPKVLSMHAGLECGILGSTYPAWDMISFGPTIRHPHSPSEYVEIDTVERFWKLLVEVLRVTE